MTDLRGVLFDKDGTLFDFARTWESWTSTVLNKLARDPSHARDMGQAIGFDLECSKFEATSVVIAGTPKDATDALMPFLPEMDDAELIAFLNKEAEAAPQFQVVPLTQVLGKLTADGLALGVVTNDAEDPARAHLSSAGVLENFVFVAGFDSGFGAKPEPGPLLAFAEAVALAPPEIVMVGDSTHDLIAGKRAGMRCVGVLTGPADKQALSPYADIVLPDIGHLHAWIKAQAAPGTLA